MADALLPREEWLASLTRSYTAAGCLLSDEQGRILIVKADYRQNWQFPGGSIDSGEDARQCAQRELLEETGLDIEPGPLLAVSWAHPSEGVDHPAVHFMFDLGTVPVGTPVVIPEGELADYRWVSPDRAVELVGPGRAERLQGALQARGDGQVRIVSHRGAEF